MTTPHTASARSVEEHRRSVEQLLRPLALRDIEEVALADALGRRVAEQVRAPLDLPVFRNSGMDGYAVRAESVAVTPATLPLAGVVAAGQAGQTPLPPGAAMKVMTGAPIPPGADCVIPVEDTHADETTVTIERGRRAGDFVREPGTDVRAGAALLAAGTLIAPRHVAALAAVGIARLPVFRRVRAAVLTTGDELMPAGVALRPGQIYNSNGIALAAALAVNGVEVVSVEHSRDDPGEFENKLGRATAAADVVFTSGGVSKGDFEVVKDVLATRGGEFGSVAVQPGGPQGLTVVDGVPVLSFPGNPVSTMVSFEVFARPILRELSGFPPVAKAEVPLLDSVRSPAGRRQFLRGRLEIDGVALVSGPGSHLIAAMAQADVLIDVPAEVTELAAGSVVKVWEL
ncbi:molybdopterin molybdotransferase MoeA [Nocardia sp. CDC159]|uniref:Molybdopterin molybdenumtransferase n=1 Tax=Nocardia pulmonis TaxID=2951408 RepID=A0A9X2EC42_9NOCA|nr:MULTISPECIES: gephyrin-like molybdotransferase Glp [Nocardia]MCM6776463.1 molybdopterin molybdotransferase MoeA [Nocardia pulmonis]MCM6788887.1 molybdopterin molybdotransferase MoeA [Nocardia sp. CDC159]